MTLLEDPSEEIFKKLGIDGELVELVDLSIEKYVKLLANDYKCKGVRFKDCVFKNTLKFEDCDLRIGIIFENCSFHELIIDSCSASGFDLNFNTGTNSILINNCKIENLFIYGCSCEREIKISKCENISKVNYSSNRCGSFGIYLSTITNVIEFSNNIAETDFRFDTSTFYNPLRISGNICSSLVFIDSIFKGDMWVWGGEVSQGIIFNRGIFEDFVKIQAVISAGTLTFSEVDFKKDCEVLYADPTSKLYGGCQAIYIDSTRFTNGLLIQGDKENNYYSIQSIDISSSNSLEGVIRTEKFIIDSLTLRGVNSNCILSFDTLKISKIVVIDYSNFSTTQFLNIASNVQLGSQISISNSNLGKTHFSNFNFRSFEGITIENVLLSEINTTNVTWFLTSQITIPRKEGISNNQALRTFYQQLKLSQEKQSDRVQALIFKSMEYEAYSREIKSGALKEVLWDRITLYFNSINRHGTNWQRPLGLIIISALTCNASIILIVTHNTSFTPTDQGILNLFKVSFYNSLSYFFQILNPAFSLEKVYTNPSFTLSAKVQAICFFYRVLYAVLLYQTVTAFRKFSK